MNAEEIKQFLVACAAPRRLCLEIAFMLGLRANELRNLAVKHLDIKRGGLHLDAAWTKNRKPGFQPLAASLVQRLLAFAPSGEPTRLYKKHYNRADTSAECTEAPLLYMPTHTARDLDIDLKVAGIPKLLPGR